VYKNRNFIISDLNLKYTQRQFKLKIHPTPILLKDEEENKITVVIYKIIFKNSSLTP
jgi:hypothetical protein